MDMAAVYSNETITIIAAIPVKSTIKFLKKIRKCVFREFCTLLYECRSGW